MTWFASFRPSRAEVWPLLVVLLAAGVLRLAWWSLDLPPFQEADSGSYVVPGLTLVDSGKFPLHPRRTPGYSLLVAASYVASSRDSLLPLLAVQHLLAVATAGLTYLLGRLLFGRAVGLLAGLLVGLDGALLLFGQMLLTEVPWAFLLVVVALLLLLAARRGSPALFGLAGLALGLLTLVRPIGEVLLLPALVVAGLALGAPRRRWVGVALLVGSFGLVVGAWVLHNGVARGTPRLTENARFLVSRLIQDDDLFVHWAASGGRSVPQDPLHQAGFQIMLSEDRQEKAGSVSLRFQHELGLSEDQAETLMQELSTAAILANLDYFTLTTLEIALRMAVSRPVDVADNWHEYRGGDYWKMLAPSGRSYAAQVLPRDPSQERFPAAQVLVGLLDPGRFGPVACLLFVVGAVAAWRQRERRPWLALAAMVVLGLTVTAATGGHEWRYRYGFDPLFLLGVAAGARALVEPIGRRLLARGRSGRAALRPARLPE